MYVNIACYRLCNDPSWVFSDLQDLPLNLVLTLKVAWSYFLKSTTGSLMECTFDCVKLSLLVLYMFFFNIVYPMIWESSWCGCCYRTVSQHYVFELDTLFVYQSKNTRTFNIIWLCKLEQWIIRMYTSYMRNCHLHCWTQCIHVKSKWSGQLIDTTCLSLVYLVRQGYQVQSHQQNNTPEIIPGSISSISKQARGTSECNRDFGWVYKEL